MPAPTNGYQGRGVEAEQQLDTEEETPPPSASSSAALAAAVAISGAARAVGESVLHWVYGSYESAAHARDPDACRVSG